MTEPIRYGAAALLLAEPRSQDDRRQNDGVPAGYPDPAKLDAAVNACESIVDVPSAGVMRRVLATVLIAVALGASGCTGSKGHAAAGPSPSAMTDERLLAIGREHAQCLRDHGISNVGEPTVWRGVLRFGQPQQEPDPVTADTAYKACQSIQDQVPAQYLYQNWKPTPADVDAMGKFANCLRQHGFPDWPNPNGDGQFPIRGTNLETAPKTDQGQEAISACQKLYDGPLLTVSP